MPDVIVPKIKVQIATSELGTDNNDIKLSTSFELKVFGTNGEQEKLMQSIKGLIVKHNEQIQGVQQLPLGDRNDDEANEDFPSSRKSTKVTKQTKKVKQHA